MAFRTNKPVVTCGKLVGGGALKFRDDKGRLVTGVPSTDDESVL
jgi:hypothetical protein